MNTPDPKVNPRHLPLSDPCGVMGAYDWRIRHGARVPRRECVNGPILSARQFEALMLSMWVVAP